MYTKLQEMLTRNRSIAKLRFDKELKKMTEETGQEYSVLKAQNEIDTNRMVSNLTHELENEIIDLDVDVRIKMSQWLSSWIYYVVFPLMDKPLRSKSINIEIKSAKVLTVAC